MVNAIAADDLVSPWNSPDSSWIFHSQHQKAKLESDFVTLVMNLEME